MDVSALRRQGRRMLSDAGSPDAAADADWLLCEALGCERGRLLFMAGEPVDEPVRERYLAWVARRASGEPVGRILKKAWFMGLEFQVPDGVLIPRSDTETLCEQALIAAREKHAQTALDLCAGSGVLAVCLAKYGGLRVWAGDLSPVCVQAVLKNAERQGVSVDARVGDLFAPFEGQRFDLIVCNPPYIPDGLPLMPEVAGYDPPLALFGGPDGLDFYRRLAAQAPGRLNRGGTLLLEFGAGQQEEIFALFARPMTFYRDLNGVCRAVRIDY